MQSNFLLVDRAKFALAGLLRSWREQRPGNKNDLSSSVTGGGWESLSHEVVLFLISFLYRSTLLLLGCFLNGKSC